MKLRYDIITLIPIFLYRMQDWFNHFVSIFCYVCDSEGIDCLSSNLRLSSDQQVALVPFEVLIRPSHELRLKEESQRRRD